MWYNIIGSLFVSIVADLGASSLGNDPERRAEARKSHFHAGRGSHVAASRYPQF